LPAVLAERQENSMTESPRSDPRARGFVRTRLFALLGLLNLVLVLACLPAEPTSRAAEQPGPFTLPTPSPPPPTPTPTAVPAMVPGTVVEEMTVKHEALTAEEVDSLCAGFLPADNRLPALYGVDTYRIWFRTRDQDGLVIAIQADLRVPRVEEPEFFPIFVYGAGTTGIASACAPLNEHFAGRDWGDYRSHMVSYASQGYIAILANWQGYDDRDLTHPYFVSELEGRVMLDAARAVYAFFEQPPDDDILARPDTPVFLGGYSQGGHGALSAGRLAAEYAPELEIKGVIGHATSPDVEGLMYDSPRYSPYIVYAYRDFYGAETVDPEDVFLAEWLPTFEEDVTSKCIDNVFQHYSNDPNRMYTPEFRAALYNDQLAASFPAFKSRLDENDSSFKPYPSVPVMLLHGAADPIVQVRTIEAFRAYLCGEGQNVRYNLYPGINHFQTRQYSFVDTLTWMESLLAGNIPVPNCPNAAAPRDDM
jgi:pimeloyl-ACP methyl ester carboxylesterase